MVHQCIHEPKFKLSQSFGRFLIYLHRSIRRIQFNVAARQYRQVVGLYKEAEKGYGIALENAFKTGNMFFVCIELLGVSFAVAGQSRLQKAIRLSTFSREYSKQNGILVPEELGLPFWLEFVENFIVVARNKLGEELNQKYEAEGKAMNIEEAVEYALDSHKDYNNT